MCGGRLEVVPCSHVGHIFRKKSPYKWRSGVNVLQRNNIRLAEVFFFFFQFNLITDTIEHFKCWNFSIDLFEFSNSSYLNIIKIIISFTNYAIVIFIFQQINE